MRPPAVEQGTSSGTWTLLTTAPCTGGGMNPNEGEEVGDREVETHLGIDREGERKNTRDSVRSRGQKRMRRMKGKKQ